MGLLRSEGVLYKPVEEIDLGPNSDELYITPIVKAPRMAGFLVKLFAWILELRIIGMIVLYFLKKDNLVHKFVSLAEIEESPVYVPLHTSKEPPKQEVICIESDQSPCERVQKAVECLPSISDKSSIEIDHCFRHWTITDYSKAYKSGAFTPTKVSEELIRAVERSSNPECNMSFFINFDVNDIRQQAVDSTLRYEKGEPLSVLDGVPIAIKDEIDCTPYPTTGGTKWLHRFRSCKRDACCVDRLRSCGALLVGKANMQELGAGVNGINPHYGATRNPYNISRITGGSSSGSAALVSAGLCPVALGVDGGGSVRIPAALCGVVGFKPTFGRVPHDGVLPLNWTVGMVGILAGTVEDALITYAAISGESSPDQSTIVPHKVELPFLKPMTFSGDIKMAKYGKPLISFRSVTDGRNRQMQFFNKIFSKADVIVTPTIGVTATRIQDNALETGELDYINGAALVRYIVAGNFLGLPAVTLPIGYDKDGLPIGLQFIGRPWSEATLLHISSVVQALYISDYKKPDVYYDLLHTP
ncbi:fatty acid amide hydrolase-like isoform X3 [Silene latifolia]|uniref:fatty acid amide hydrolase-like isoform X3 n=1 Tax=Silene latifolia TaxID=37657 RepID=UPI003D78950C